MSAPDLTGKVALVAGATRGAGRAIAVELARAGATVYAAGRSSRVDGRSEIGRPETIEETGELIAAAGGNGVALRVDHLEPDQVRALVERIDADHGRLDILVNDIFGGDRYAQFGTTLWEHDLDGGLRMLRMGIDTHVITSHFALPLLIRRPGGLVVEMTDGTAEYNVAYRHQVGFFYDLVKAAVQRMTTAQAYELAPHGGAAVAVTPGWLRSENMLDAFGVTEDNWRDALDQVPHFAISETPTFVGRAVTALAGDPDVGEFSGRVVSSGQLAQRYGVTDVDGSRPDCWRYLVEVQDPDLPANTDGYR
ncbi:SDR family oxidoreductase [Rhodococcus hoagii]|nr:SDR family oxidoreductase [Prescottella equi]MBM4652008.1 SDR family oxidoreductase [Prescottella equi]MBM4684238.1 SDR family oxidoreductase [Prescottella equi]